MKKVSVVVSATAELRVPNNWDGDRVMRELNQSTIVAYKADAKLRPSQVTKVFVTSVGQVDELGIETKAETASV